MSLKDKREKEKIRKILLVQISQTDLEKSNLENLKINLNLLRKDVQNGNLKPKEALKAYTNIVNSLLEIIAKKVEKIKNLYVYKNLDASLGLLKLIDEEGIKRALGSAYFETGKFKKDFFLQNVKIQNTLSLLKILIPSQIYLDIKKIYSGDLEIKLKKLESSLIKTISGLEYFNLQTKKIDELYYLTDNIYKKTFAYIKDKEIYYKNLLIKLIFVLILILILSETIITNIIKSITESINDINETLKHSFSKSSENYLKKNIYKNDEIGNLARRVNLTINMLNKAILKAKETLQNEIILKSVISHEVRNLLNANLNYINLVKKDKNLSPNQKNFLEKAYKSALLSTYILDDAINLSNLSNIKIKKEKVNLKNLFKDVIDFCLPLKKQEVSFLNKINLDKEYLCDRQKLFEIFFNLLSNAFKYTLQGKVEIGISKIQPKGEVEEITFYVKDSGIGIKNKNKVFNFLNREEKALKISQGHGIGLFFIKKLVDALNGKIEFESEEGKGTTFYITLPLRVYKDKVKDNLQVEKDISLKDKDILIVDDIPFNREILKLLLEKYNPKSIDFAENGKEALEKILKKNFDLIFLDMVMPIMSGYELVETLKKVKPSVLNKIILVTGQEYKDKTFEIEKNGFLDIITKPITDKKLKDVLLKL